MRPKTRQGPTKVAVVLKEKTPRSYQEGGCRGKKGVIVKIRERVYKGFCPCWSFCPYPYLSLFTFSFAQLVVLAALLFVHFIWATFIRGPFIFGLMLAFDLSIFMPFSFPESLPLPLPMSSLPFVKRVTGGSPQGLGQESVWVGANRRLVGENSVRRIGGREL